MPNGTSFEAPSPLVDALTRHYDELVDQLRRRFKDKGFAHEVVNDVCVQLLERPPAQEIQRPRAFLSRLALHRAIDRYRAQRDHGAVVCSTDELPEPYAVPGLLSGPELAAAAAQRQRILLEAIRALPPRSQDVFILTRLYHLQQDEVAKHLGISRGMVARHLARALQDLRPILLGAAQENQ